MKKLLITVFLLFSPTHVACGADGAYVPANGDIVFQESRSAQSRAIQLVTGSRYSHMGIVYLSEGRPLVFEAVQPVKSTPLDEWIARGEDGHVVAKRLGDTASVLTPEALSRMREVGTTMDGKPYDLRFEWSDDRMYCSELVWKIYERALAIKLSDLESFSDFELEDPEVRTIVDRRWPAGPPKNEPVVSPRAIFDSRLLETVFEN